VETQLSNIISFMYKNWVVGGLKELEYISSSRFYFIYSVLIVMLFPPRVNLFPHLSDFSYLSSQEQKYEDDMVWESIFSILSARTQEDSLSLNNCHRHVNI
jgi:hypothetical protein